MIKKSSKFAFILALFLSAAWLDAASFSGVLLESSIAQIADGGSLTVTQVTDSSADMVWTMTGSAPYHVTVTDLTTSTVLTSFTTSGTSANIGNLLAGHTYHFEVTNALETTITDQLIVSG